MNKRLKISYKEAIKLISNALNISYKLLDKYNNFFIKKEEYDNKINDINKDLDDWGKTVGEILAKISDDYLIKVNNVCDQRFTFSYKDLDERIASLGWDLKSKIKVMNDIKNEIVSIQSEKLAKDNIKLGCINLILVIMVGIITFIGVYLAYVSLVIQGIKFL